MENKLIFEDFLNPTVKADIERIALAHKEEIEMHNKKLRGLVSDSALKTRVTKVFRDFYPDLNKEVYNFFTSHYMWYSIGSDDWNDVVYERMEVWDLKRL